MKIFFLKIFKQHLPIIIFTSILLIGFWILNNNIQVSIPSVLYWDYARHFQAANLDSPYMLPLLIKLYTLLFGTSALAFEYIKFLVFIIATIIIYAIIYPLYGKKVALLATAMFCALPVQGKFFEHLDYHLAVILFFVCLLWSITAWQRIQKNKYLYLSGAFLGMMLMSQFESVLLAIGLMCATFCVPSYRALWKIPAFYGGLAIAFCFVFPFLIWQWQHDWLTIHYLATSNGAAFNILGFINAILDYVGSLGLFLILLVLVLFKRHGLEQFDSNSLFFFYLWIFIFVLLSFMFMFNPIRHTTLINANCALFLFLGIMGYRLFPRLTVVLTLLMLFLSVGYLILSLIVSYSNNYLSFSALIEPLLKKDTVIVSNVIPHDSSPSFFSINLPGQPQVFAMKKDRINFLKKGNPAVYLWQPSFRQLLTEAKHKNMLLLTDEAVLRNARWKQMLKCQPVLPLTITINTVDSVQQLLTRGKHRKSITIYAHRCMVL